MPTYVDTTRLDYINRNIIFPFSVSLIPTNSLDYTYSNSIFPAIISNTSTYQN